MRPGLTKQLVICFIFSYHITYVVNKDFPIGFFLSNLSNDNARKTFKESLRSFNAKTQAFKLISLERTLSEFNDFDTLKQLSKSRNYFFFVGELEEGVLEAVEGFTWCHQIPFISISNPIHPTFHFRHFYDKFYPNSNKNNTHKEDDFQSFNRFYEEPSKKLNPQNYDNTEYTDYHYSRRNNKQQKIKEERTRIGLENRMHKYIFYMKPMYERAMLDLILKHNKTNVYFVYDSSEGLHRLDQLHKMASLSLNLTLSIEAFKLKDIYNSHMILKQLDMREKGGEDKYIVLDMSSQEALEAILKQVQAVGMNRAGYHYLLGGMLIDELNIEDFKHGGVNITGFQLLNNSDPSIKIKQSNWKKNFRDAPLKLQAALVSDATLVMFTAFKSAYSSNRELMREFLKRSQEYKQQNTDLNSLPSANSRPLPWHKNSIMFNEVKKTKLHGVTGPIMFDSNGLRKDYSLQVKELKLNTPLKKIGMWTYENGLEMEDSKKNKDEDKEVYINKTRIVTTIISPPFLYPIKKKEDDAVTTASPSIKLEPTGLEEYQGYCADLTMKLAEIVNFKYFVKIAPDKKYGEKTDNGTWNGMVGQLTTKKADVAIAPLTITSIRERVIDFTKPFMNLGISIMIKKPEKQKPGVFSFMDPLALNIWACIVISYLAVSFVLFLVSRFSPYEWQAEDGKDSSNGVIIESSNNNTDNNHFYGSDNNNNHAKIPKEDPSAFAMASGYTNDFTVLNSLWFSLAAFMRQGTDISPRSLSGRVVGSAWWFFTLIIISSYTANLAAFLTVERMLTPIENVDDLAKQSEIMYGTLLAGSTKDFFKNSRISTFENMWIFMNTNQEVFVDSTEAGVNRVRNSKGKYAFLLESTMNDYHNQKKPCNTMKVGNDLDSKGYGVATPIGSDLREPVGLAILQLLEKDYLAKLHKKWWFDKGECLPEDSKGGGPSQSALTLSNVAGIFYILIGGLGLSMITSLLEFIYKSKKEISIHKKTFAAEVCKLGNECGDGGFKKDSLHLSQRPPAYHQLMSPQPEAEPLPPQSSDEFVLRSNRSAIVLV